MARRCGRRRRCVSSRPVQFFFLSVLLLCIAFPLVTTRTTTAISEHAKVTSKHHLLSALRAQEQSGLFLLGPPHSGVSLLAALLQLSYYHVMTNDSATNFISSPPSATRFAHGLFESPAMHTINDVILRRSGHSWLSLCRLDQSFFSKPEEASSHLTRSAASRLFAHLNSETRSAAIAPIWVIQDPRLALTLPFWTSYTTPSALHCVIVYRDVQDSAVSIAHYHHIPIRTAMALWEAYYTFALGACRNLPTLVLRFDKLVKSPKAEVESLQVWLRGLTHAYIPKLNSTLLGTFARLYADRLAGEAEAKDARRKRNLEDLELHREGWRSLDSLSRHLNALTHKREGRSAMRREAQVDNAPVLRISPGVEEELCRISPNRKPWYLGDAEGDEELDLVDVQ